VLPPLLRPRSSNGVPKRLVKPTRYSSAPSLPPLPTRIWGGRSSNAAVAIAYSLVECRTFELAFRLFKQVTSANRLSPLAKARLLLVHAVALERRGTDLRAAQTLATEAVRSATQAGSVRTRILALDESGVIARRQGKYKAALSFYDCALKLARTTRCPTWLVMQIRSNRAIALEYLKRRTAALREYHVVASYEMAIGDLVSSRV
jgi:tetratricopeptide (TPR) repeat protein